MTRVVSERQTRGVEVIGTSLEGEDVTHVIFILDRSGSMRGKEEDVIGGFNAYVDELRGNNEGAVGISYVRFDNKIELVWNDVSLADVPRMSRATYRVRGMTALLDAVGIAVSAVREHPQHRYIVVTNTDGLENASQEWTAEGVKALIEEREKRGNWSFAFFGEGVNAWSQASAYGFAAGMAMPYDKDDARAVYSAKARVSNVMRGRKIPATKAFATAAAAIMKDEKVSDEDVVAILKGGK